MIVCWKSKAMEFSNRELDEFAWKLNKGRWNPLATTAVIPFLMSIRVILIHNLDYFDGERNACQFVVAKKSFSPSPQFWRYI